MTPTIDIVEADVLEWARKFDGEKFHALIADPPSGISFMNIHWDHDKGGRDKWIAWMTEVFVALRVHLLPGAHLFVWGLPRTSHWTTMAIENAGFEIRDVVVHLQGAGFPKSLSVGKSIDKTAGAEREIVGNARWAGREGAPSNTEQWRLRNEKPRTETIAATSAAQQWESHGTALKPASEHWILARNPLTEHTIAENCVKHGVGALNIDAARIPVHATADASQLRTMERGVRKPEDGWGLNDHEGGTTQVVQPSGRWPANVTLSHSPECQRIGQKKIKAISGTNCGRGAVDEYESGCYGKFNATMERGTSTSKGDADGTETVDDWQCVESCPIRKLNEQAGDRGAAAPVKGTEPSHTGSDSTVCYNKYGRVAGPFHEDSGGANRFFFNADWSHEIEEQIANADVFRYEAKPSGRERHAGVTDDPAPVSEHGATLRKVESGLKEVGHNRFDTCATCGGTILQNPDLPSACKCEKPVRVHNVMRGNHHPTLKSISLCKWLSTLLLPPKEYAPRRILIPFAGTCSEAISAILAGFEHVTAIEREAEYVAIGRKRVAWWTKRMQETRFTEPKAILAAKPKIKRQKSAEHPTLAL